MVWVILGLVVFIAIGSFVLGYFIGRNDERKWNQFYYSYGHFYGRRQERRRHNGS